MPMPSNRSCRRRTGGVHRRTKQRQDTTPRPRGCRHARWRGRFGAIRILRFQIRASFGAAAANPRGHPEENHPCGRDDEFRPSSAALTWPIRTSARASRHTPWSKPRPAGSSGPPPSAAASCFLTSPRTSASAKSRSCWIARRSPRGRSNGGSVVGRRQRHPAPSPRRHRLALGRRGVDPDDWRDEETALRQRGYRRNGAGRVAASCPRQTFLSARKTAWQTECLPTVGAADRHRDSSDSGKPPADLRFAGPSRGPAVLRAEWCGNCSPAAACPSRSTGPIGWARRKSRRPIVAREPAQSPSMCSTP